MGEEQGSNNHADMLRRATTASVATAVVLIVIKTAAFVLTDSMALLSSLVDSVLDSLASIINYVAVRHALSPADREHRFGHGKAEPLAGLGQAAFIAGSSLFLVFESLNRLINPVTISRGNVGIAVTVASLALTVLLVWYQRRVVRATGSLAIRADSLHYASDIILNLSVIVALVLSTRAGITLADPLFALAIAGFIVRSAWEIAQQSMKQLMDHELPDEDRQRILDICRSHPEVIDVHELRTRSSGMDKFIQLHLELDRSMPLSQAHRIADEVEVELRRKFDNADVIIHQDPAGEEDVPRKE